MDDFHQIYIQNEAYVRKCLYWMLSKETIDDVVQEVFVKVWMNLKKFENKSSIKTWIYRIAANCAYDHIRKEKKYVANEQIDDVAAEVGGDFEAGQIHQQLLKKAVGELSAKQRVVFVLFYIQELSVEEVAEALKLSVGTVKSRLFGAREVMSAELQKHGVKL